MTFSNNCVLLPVWAELTDARQHCSRRLDLATEATQLRSTCVSSTWYVSSQGLKQDNYTSTFQECSFKVEESRRWSWASRETTVARGHRAGFQRATAQGVPRISWEFHPGPDKVRLRACTGGKAWGWRKNQMSISGVQGSVLPRITGTTLAPADLAENREYTGHWVQYEDKFRFKTGE